MERTLELAVLKLVRGQQTTFQLWRKIRGVFPEMK